MSYRITLERNTLRFSAAHFTTFAGQAEPLHGHNYDVLVEVEGGLTEDSWVLDFVDTKKIVARLCHELDHRFLLPLRNPDIRISESADEYEVRHANKRYVMPKSDVAALDIENSTAELLAEWLAVRLRQELEAEMHLTSIKVGVEEAPGQAAWFTSSFSRHNS